MQNSTSTTQRRPMTKLTKAALAIGAGLLTLLTVAPMNAVADTATDLTDAQRLLRQCQLDLQYATTSAERTRAQQCITIKQKVIAGLTAAPTPSSSASASPSATMTPSPTTAPTSPTASPTASPTPTSTGTPPAGAWPTATNRGVSAGWEPIITRSGTWIIDQSGTYTDVQVNGSINVVANNVTLRRVKVVGGIINNRTNGVCYNGLLMEDVTVTRSGSVTPDVGNDGAIGVGGYTARRVAILDMKEGFRVGGESDAGCGPVLIEDSYARATSPGNCGDWHGDALQGYDANTLTIRHSTLVLNEVNGCAGTGAFFYPLGQSPFTVDGLLVQGGGYSFRTDTNATVNNLMVVDGSWRYGPVEWDITCDNVPGLRANIVRLDSNGQPTTAVRTQAC